MLRVRCLSVCVALSVLLFAPGCKKKAADAEGEDAVAQTSGSPKPDTTPAPAPTPTPTPDPVAADTGASSGGGAGSSGGSGAGSSGGSGGANTPPREDLTCDPTDKAGCLEGEQCIGAQGCDATWSCDAQIVCAKGVKEYCGCDGRTFEAVYGNCPWQKYEYPGPCK